MVDDVVETDVEKAALVAVLFLFAARYRLATKEEDGQEHSVGPSGGFRNPLPLAKAS